MVVRYSIGWRGRAERGIEVIARWLLGFMGGGAKGLCCWAMAVDVKPAVSESIRVRAGYAGFIFGAGEVRRVSRICVVIFCATLNFPCRMIALVNCSRTGSYLLLK